jgi:hypothetical protein
MGLLDQFANLNPEQTQGLLAAASQILQQSGDPRRPFGIGQAMGAGIEAYQGSTQAAQRRKQEEEQLRQVAQMRGLQMQNMQGDIANEALTREQARKNMEREQRIRERMLAGAQAQAMPQAAPAALGSMAPGGPGSPKTDAPDWMQAYQAQQGQPGAAPVQAMAAPAAEQDIEQQAVQSLLMEAEIRKSEGDLAGAARLRAEAIKMLPEFGQTPQVGRGQDNVPYNYVLDKRGNEKRLSALPRRDIKLMDRGGQFDAYDADALTPGQNFAKTFTTGDRVALAGQGKVDARSAEANRIAAGGKVVDISTGLRKEFEDLPEVKGYKVAVPAYKAIVDAAKRNTPMSDINLVYGIAKLYDPTSVVREGEYNTVANSPNIPEKIKGLAQYLAGGGRLTSEVKAQIQREAQGRMQSYEGQFTAARTNYEDIAKRAGGDPSLVFPSPYKSPVTPKKDNARTVKRTGTINGRKVIEYSDGSVEYGN